MVRDSFGVQLVLPIVRSFCDKLIDVPQWQPIRCRLTLDEVPWRFLTRLTGLLRAEDSWVAYRIGY